MTERLLKLRKSASKRRPSFNRQETWKLKRFKNNPTWRKPRGHSSKMRRQLKGNPPLVRIGYRGPKDVRAFHPCGLPEAFVYSVADLEGVHDAIVRIASGVGTKKRADIVRAAVEKNLRIANPRIKFVYLDSVETLELYAPIKEHVTSYRIAKVADNVQQAIVAKAEEMKIPVEFGA
ncbi:MAG: 50S ribosomal protein L32e [Candidatus Methanofastidiosa archaeon]|nr:50S ribosomal protein L32e [Candidatus Methanofastidiosa archaeon]MDD4280628.1 50S ribosomal protein L32e [Candidatus Methanofastidiosa archaeon]